MTLDLFPEQEQHPLFFETRLKGQGYRYIAGVDEAGRGPLAGPVVAAAVILPEGFDLPGLDDSKKLSEKVREELYPEIRRQAYAFGIGVASPAEIDRINILQATLLAMGRAIDRMRTRPDYLLIDGITPIPLPLPQKTLKKGDHLSLSIAAASILAKVVRDRLMTFFDRRYPGYGFAGHKGYCCKQHFQAIAELGPCPIHRTTFSGVREYLPPLI
ncbi:MAG: ribonuclease HII [Syntrophotaleaceae bacterium]